MAIGARTRLQIYYAVAAGHMGPALRVRRRPIDIKKPPHDPMKWSWGGKEQQRNGRELMATSGRGIWSLLRRGHRPLRVRWRFGKALSGGCGGSDDRGRDKDTVERGGRGGDLRILRGEPWRVDVGIDPYEAYGNPKETVL